MRINKHDTNGTKPLLGKGELGYDDYVAGGDTGRVYVGTGTENIALAERLESNMMTKAQFNALAEERKANRAGSGFDNFGKGSSTATVNVNEGIWTDPVQVNKFYLGKTTANSGASKTNHAETVINGVMQELKNVNSSTALAEILCPVSPSIYPFDVILTTEQIASGVIKHADASNSGLIVNGKFAVDTSGWSELTSTISSSSGELLINTTDFAGGAIQTFPTVIGKRYIVKGVGRNITSTDIKIRIVPFTTSTIIAESNISTTTTNSLLTVEFTATETSMRVYVRAAGVSKQAIFDNIEVYPADAISRSDLVFLELTTSNAA